jgi:AcrR family transcriptional regulator
VPRAALAADEIAAFRRRAIAAATHLFASQGYDAVTMRAVAAKLGVSAMTTSRYFEDKQALFAGVRADAFRRFAERLEAALQGRGAPLLKLRRLKQAYIGFAVDQPDAYRIMFELSQPNPDDPELAAQSARAFGALHRSVAEAVAAGDLDGDPLTIAHLLWADTHGLVSLHLAGKLVGRSLAELAKIDHELPASRARRKS